MLKREWGNHPARCTLGLFSGLIVGITRVTIWVIGVINLLNFLPNPTSISAAKSCDADLIAFARRFKDVSDDL